MAKQDDGLLFTNMSKRATSIMTGTLFVGTLLFLALLVSSKDGYADCVIGNQSEYLAKVSNHPFGIEIKGEHGTYVTVSEVSVVFEGKRRQLRGLSELKCESEYIEYGGWLSKKDGLWYRGLLKPNKMGWVNMVHWIVDRHENHPTEAVYDRYWYKRRIGHLTIVLGTSVDLGAGQYRQYNAFSGTDSAHRGRITEQVGWGGAHWHIVSLSDGQYQLQHEYDDSGETALVIEPGRSGKYTIELFQQPLLSPYPAANEVVVEIVTAETVTKWRIDQAKAINELGVHELEENSRVILRAVGEEGDRTVFDGLRLTDEKGELIEIRPLRLSELVIDNAELGLAIADFWQKAPTSVEWNREKITVTGAEEEAMFAGGAGMSLEIAVNVDPAKVTNEVFAAGAFAPPKISKPAWLMAIEYSETEARSYLQILEETKRVIEGDDDWFYNYGWKDWGDYQTGPSYHSDEGVIENWGALQYDLGTGLLFAWMHTGDPYLWRRARAAVRNIMDVQVVKYAPYKQKSSGAGLRKGECEVNWSHWCQEAIPEYNYHARALLLYAHLTNESWAYEIAQMLADNSAYFAQTRSDWLLESDRPLAWALRNLYYGTQVFEGGTVYLDIPEVDRPALKKGTSYRVLWLKLLDQLVDKLNEGKRFPGDQPVWQGQVAEGMIIALESGELPESAKRELSRAFDIGMQTFVREDFNSLSEKPSIRYYETEWVPADNYAGLWVSSLAYHCRVYQNVDSCNAGKTLWKYMIGLYSSEEKVFNPRDWSALLGFSSYAAGIFSRDE